MAWVYILEGSSGRHYIGSTIELEARLAQHLRGHTYTTQRLGTLKVAAKREYPSLIQARRVERLLKAKKNPGAAILPSGSHGDRTYNLPSSRLSGGGSGSPSAMSSWRTRSGLKLSSFAASRVALRSESTIHPHLVLPAVTLDSRQDATYPPKRQSRSHFLEQ